MGIMCLWLHLTTHNLLPKIVYAEDSMNLDTLFPFGVTSVQGTFPKERICWCQKLKTVCGSLPVGEPLGNLKTICLDFLDAPTMQMRREHTQRKLNMSFRSSTEQETNPELRIQAFEKSVVNVD